MAGVWIGAALIAAFVRPDLRGPLAAVVDLDLAGHAEEARQRFAGLEDLIREFDLDPDLLRPPLASELATWSSRDFALKNEVTIGGRDDDNDDDLETSRLAALLTEHGRDGIARAYYRTLLHARRHDLETARADLRALMGMRDTPRCQEFLFALSEDPGR